jgi:UDP-N-acetyl-D-glucosamine dehydrogenase
MNKYYNTLKKKIQNRELRIAIAGMGYVGLPLAKTIADAEYRNIIGLDIDLDKIKKINNGMSVINTLEVSDLENLLASGFRATSDFSLLDQADALVICVPTPLNQYKEPDLSYIVSTVEMASKFLSKGVFLSLESTTWPGTTEEVIAKILENAGFSIGKDLFLGYSPEREDPGRSDYTTATIPKIISGQTNQCLHIAESFYGSFINEVVRVSNPKTAELVKLLENIQRSVNIGLMNEMKMIADKMNINIFEVIEAAASKPFGFTKYLPGPGVGGHCIPVDPFYLTWKAKEFNFHTKFIELAGEINDGMPNYIIQRITSILNNYKKAISGSKLLILGLSYKKNISDLRESPNLEILQELITLGAEVDYSDPFFENIPPLRKFNFNMKSQSLNKDSIASYDLVILLTDHDTFDYELIKKYSKHIVDTRGIFKLDKTTTYA